MKNKALIIWEKWQDPILSHLGDMSMVEPDSDVEKQYDDIIEDIEELNDNKIYPKYPIIITPMGLLAYNEKTACDKTFNFWTGHTNFSITNEISKILEECSGVETLDVFTRYRFRISIGKAFKDSTTMNAINNKIYEHINEHEYRYS